MPDQSHSVHVFQNKGAHGRCPAGFALVKAHIRTRFHKIGQEAAGVHLLSLKVVFCVKVELGWQKIPNICTYDYLILLYLDPHSESTKVQSAD